MFKGMNLVIVESPTKARTLAKFLGDTYRIEATFGHVRDLPERKIGVQIDHDFEPEYVQTKKQKERTDEIKKVSRQASQVYLATDPDREGEAIAFHIYEMLKNSKNPGTPPAARLPAGQGGQVQNSKFGRIVFHEITDSAIRNALTHPRDLDMQLINAQQARRVLDRLVGYKLSPLLWKKVRRGLSAGRVQSVAVRLIVEREREIEAFRPQEFWQILVKLQTSKNQELQVGLKKKNNQDIKIENQSQAEEVERELRKAEYRVESVEQKDFARTPPPPFTTSTLQQAASNRLGWSAKRTMQIAQTLYEEGWITYHRTDSTHIAADAAQMAAVHIAQNFGPDYALAKPRFYKAKSKVAQEAHEAIRPTVVSNQLSVISGQLNRDQGRLYELIWKRFVACQMAPVRGVTVTVVVDGTSEQGKRYQLEVRGETIGFAGWYKVAGGDSNQLPVDSNQLPQLDKGEELGFVDLTSEQKFTLPSARYNDAGLIKALEELDIGRPSTYAPIISTIQDRQYVEKEDLPAGRQVKRFRPTALGVAVNDFLVANFSDIVNYKFTARMEDELDEIANGDRQWRPTIGDFYTPFAKKLDQVSQEAQRVKVQVEETGETCPQCRQGKVVIRIGKYGKFLACSRYPDCAWKSNYQNKTGIKCPLCHEGDVIVRKTRTRRSFYGCSNYPKCKFASWTRPAAAT